MNNLFLNILIFLSVFNCENNKKEVGFLFVKISEIYHRNGEVIILDKNKSQKFLFKNKEVFVNDKSFEIINEEYLYSNLINVESFNPEYGLFILKVISIKNGFYEVLINNEKYFINIEKYANILSFKTEQQYVLDAYPNPTEKNPLRVKPNEESKTLENYKNYTYVSLEIVGDWLKVKDDKDCYPGEYPSEKNIIGWIRWRENGKIIIDLRHRC